MLSTEPVCAKSSAYEYPEAHLRLLRSNDDIEPGKVGDRVEPKTHVMGLRRIAFGAAAFVCDLFFGACNFLNTSFQMGKR